MRWFRIAQLFLPKFAASNPEEYERFRETIEDYARGNPYPFSAWFGADGRAYFPFEGRPAQGPEAEGGVDPDVANALADGGCEVTDYPGGYCRRGNRTLRIGKVIQQLKNKDLQTLRQRAEAGEIYDLERELQEASAYYDDVMRQFMNSPYRAAKSGRRTGLTVVVSQNPHDLGAMSTGRRWTSCMRLGEGAHHEDLYCEVESGGLVAYLVRNDDREIRDPLARIHIRRFENRQGQSVAVPEGEVYGDDVDGFSEAVQGWLNERQGEVSGMYERRGGEYSDTFGDELLVAPSTEEGLLSWLKGEHPDALYSTWQVNDDLYEDAEDTFGRYGNEIPIENLSRTFQTKEEAEQYLQYVQSGEQDEYEREHMGSGWAEVDEETGEWEQERFSINEETHDHRRDMKNTVAKKVLDAPPGTYSDEVMQEVKKHVWDDAAIYSPLKRTLIKKRPDLLSEKDVEELDDKDGLEYLISLSPEKRQKYLTGWKKGIETYLDDPGLLLDEEVENAIARFKADPKGKDPAGRDMLDYLSGRVFTKFYDAVLDPAKHLFEPIPADLAKKIVGFVGNIDESYGAPISQSDSFNNLLSSVVQSFSQTDTDTPTVQGFYGSLLSRVSPPEKRGPRRPGHLSFETVVWAISSLGENGRAFLPWVRENIATQAERVESLRAKEEAANWASAVSYERKTAEDNLEKLLYAQDAIESGTGRSRKYRFYDDRRWSRETA